MRRALLLLAALATPTSAALSERDLARAVARPPAGTRLPAAVPFMDDAGRRTDLGRVAGGRALVLVFADYTCRHVCAPGLVLTAGALHDTGLAAGRDYRLAVVGFDPRDTAADTRRMAAQVEQAPDVARATAMLTGDAATHALGYGYILFFSIKYRRGTAAKRGPVPEKISREVEIGWTAVTAFGFLFFFWFAAVAEIPQFDVPKKAMEIHVVAKQWMWKTEHPNGAREINALHVPIGVPVRLVMTSQDVIHSFSCPRSVSSATCCPAAMSRRGSRRPGSAPFTCSARNIAAPTTRGSVAASW